MDYLAEPPSPARSKRAGSTVNPLCVTKAKKLKVSKPKNSSKSFKCVIRAAYEAKKSSLELLDHRKQRCSRGLRFENLSAHKKHVDALLHSPIRFRKCQHCPYYFLEPRLDDHQRECKGKPASKGAKAQLEIWQHMYGQLVPDEPFPYAYCDRDDSSSSGEKECETSYESDTSTTAHRPPGSPNAADSDPGEASQTSSTPPADRAAPPDHGPNGSLQPQRQLATASQAFQQTPQLTPPLATQGVVQSTSPFVALSAPQSAPQTLRPSQPSSPPDPIVQKLLAEISELAMVCSAIGWFEHDLTSLRELSTCIVTCQTPGCNPPEDIIRPQQDALHLSRSLMPLSQNTVVRAIGFETSALIYKYSWAATSFDSQSRPLRSLTASIQVCEHSLCKLGNHGTLCSSEWSGTGTIPIGGSCQFPYNGPLPEYPGVGDRRVAGQSSHVPQGGLFNTGWSLLGLSRSVQNTKDKGQPIIPWSGPKTHSLRSSLACGTVSTRHSSLEASIATATRRTTPIADTSYLLPDLSNSLEEIAHQPRIKPPNEDNDLAATQNRTESSELVNRGDEAVEKYLSESTQRCFGSRQRQRPDDLKYAKLQCTSRCGKRFERVDQWRRHEEINRPQDLWVCTTCLRIGEAPYIHHRRDKLREHIRSRHTDIVNDLSPVLHRRGKLRVDLAYREPADVEFELNASRREIPRPQTWQCGFCGLKPDSWRGRIEHVARHFETGADMRDWSEPYHDRRDVDLEHRDHDDDDPIFERHSGDSVLTRDSGFVEGVLHPGRKAPGRPTAYSSFDNSINFDDDKGGSRPPMTRSAEARSRSYASSPLGDNVADDNEPLADMTLF